MSMTASYYLDLKGNLRCQCCDELVPPGSANLEEGQKITVYGEPEDGTCYLEEMRTVALEKVPA